MRRLSLLTKAAAVAFAVLAMSSTASAAFIYYNDSTVGQNGTGFGNVLNLLSVQNNPSESGSVLWNGTKDVTTGDAKNTSQTYSVADLAANGITASSNFEVIFNVNQTGAGGGQILQLHTFSLVFQDASGNTLFTATYDATNPADLPNGGQTANPGIGPIDQGSGKSGYLFVVSLTAAEAAQFFGTSTNRVGGLVPTDNPINNISNDGQENFFLTTSETIPPAIPEPASMALCLAGLAFGSGAYLRRRRRLLAIA